MAVTLRSVRHHLRQPLAIVGKTAAGQHHGASFDVNLPAVAAQLAPDTPGGPCSSRTTGALS